MNALCALLPSFVIFAGAMAFLSYMVLDVRFDDHALVTFDDAGTTATAKLGYLKRVYTLRGTEWLDPITACEAPILLRRRIERLHLMRKGASA